VLRRLGIAIVGLVVVGGGLPALARAQEAVDPCELLTRREVARALGEPVLDGQPEARDLPGTAGHRDTCTWPTEDPNSGVVEGIPLSIVVSVQTGCQPDAASCFEGDEQRERDESKPLPGPGDDAFYVFTGEVESLIDDMIVNVHFNSFDTNMYSRREFERRTVRLAKKAVRRV
jgi:hypothetical protein